MTEAQLIAAILQEEGGYVDDPTDLGGPTNWGITSRSWGTFKGFGRPATREEVKAITREQAVQFYQTRYLTNSPFASIAYEPLRCQCIDYSVLSGTAAVWRSLQSVLDLEQTGILDERTKAALVRDRGPLVNRALIAARVRFFRAIVADHPTQKKFLNGWTARALTFWE